MQNPSAEAAALVCRHALRIESQFYSPNLSFLQHTQTQMLPFAFPPIIRRRPISLLGSCAFVLLLTLAGVRLQAQCCDYTLAMQDTYGDGWDGATMTVLVNGVAVGTYTATGYGNSVTVTVCNGDTVELNYTAGAYENEHLYTFYDAAWNLLHSDGPTPATGLVFDTIADCSTPFIPGNHPCTAIPIDTGMCLWGDNTGYPSSGMDPLCAAYSGGDVWYRMAVPASGGLSFETSLGSLTDTGIGVWKGSTCSTATRIGCDDDGGAGYYSFLLLYDLTPGDSLFIQVFGYGGGAGTFQLCVEDIPAVKLDSSELPIVMINSLSQPIPENTKINCLMDIKYNGAGSITHVSDPSNIYSGHIGIEIRGASSSSYPQKPYNLETRDAAGANLDVSLLGMPAENDWVLLSHFNDRSLLKNLLGYKLFEEMGNYSVRAQLCEVLLDSAYRGIYLIGEKVKRDSGRVDIAKLTAADTTGDDLTGGYILQQNYWNASNSFLSNYSPIDHPTFPVHFVYEYPAWDEILPAQKTYIAAFVDSLETALYSTDFANPVTGYRKYLDVPSFIDYFIVNEVSRNNDGFKKSVFFHKDKFSNGGKLKAGPVWDFDWAWKSIAGCSIFEGYDGSGWAHHINDCFTDNYSTGWYIRLQQDSTFNNELRCAYENYRATVLDTAYLFAYIDSMGTLVNNAKERHFQKWPLLGKSGPAPDYGPVATTYAGELDSLKSWITKRLAWLDANIPGYCAPVGTVRPSVTQEVICHPNPANDHLMVSYSLSAAAQVEVRLYNYLGEEVLAVEQTTEAAGAHSLRLDTAPLAAGVYILQLRRGAEVVNKKVVLTH
jgi:hypothetical protein